MDDVEKRVVDLVAEVLVDVKKENIRMDSKIVEVAVLTSATVASWAARRSRSSKDFRN